MLQRRGNYFPYFSVRYFPRNFFLYSLSLFFVSRSDNPAKSISLKLYGLRSPYFEPRFPSRFFDELRRENSFSCAVSEFACYVAPRHIVRCIRNHPIAKRAIKNRASFNLARSCVRSYLARRIANVERAY